MISPQYVDGLELRIKELEGKLDSARKAFGKMVLERNHCISEETKLRVAAESRLDAYAKQYNAAQDDSLRAIRQLQSRLHSCELERDHYRNVLEEIVREGSDTYGIVSKAAQEADSALNAVLDNAALTVNPQIVVERQESLSARLERLGFNETGEGDTISRKWPGPE